MLCKAQKSNLNFNYEPEQVDNSGQISSKSLQVFLIWKRNENNFFKADQTQIEKNQRSLFCLCIQHESNKFKILTRQLQSQINLCRFF